MEKELCAGEDNSWKAHSKHCYHCLVQRGEGWAFSSRVKDSLILATGP